MNIITIKSPNGLAHTFERLSNSTLSWKDNQVTFPRLNYLIHMHLRLICAQTGNPLTAPRLQQAMFNLSTRITTEFRHISGGSALGYELACQALGLYSHNKISFQSPPELLLQIFSQLPPKNNKDMHSNLWNVALVCKTWREVALKAKGDWALREDIHYSTFNIHTHTSAIEYAFNNHLQGLNLSDYSIGLGYNLDLGIVKTTSKNYPDLKHLNLSYWIYFNTDRIPFPNLVSLNLSNCMSLTEENLEKCLESLPGLEKLILAGCKNITGINIEKSLEKIKDLDVSHSGFITLGDLPNAEKLNFEGCTQIEGDILEKALLTARQLRHLNLNDCTQLSGYSFTKVMTVSTQLKTLSIGGFHISERKYKALKGRQNIEILNMGNCKIREKKLLHLIKSLPKLRILNLERCNTGKLLAKAPEFSNITDLNLSHCLIPEKGLWLKILRRFPNVTTLNLAYSNISENELLTILDTQPCLKNLILNQEYPTSLIKSWRLSYPHIHTVIAINNPPLLL